MDCHEMGGEGRVLKTRHCEVRSNLYALQGELCMFDLPV